MDQTMCQNMHAHVLLLCDRNRATSDAMVAAMGVAQAARQRKFVLNRTMQFGEKDNSAARIQAGVRGAVDRAQMGDMDLAGSRLQGAVRGILARRHVSKLEKDYTASCALIQAGIRGTVARQDADAEHGHLFHESAEVIQGLVRGKEDKDHYAAVAGTAIVLQGGIRGILGRRDFKQKEFDAKRALAAETIQGGIRGATGREDIWTYRMMGLVSANRINAMLKSVHSRRQFDSDFRDYWEKACIRMNAVVRGKLGRRQGKAIERRLNARLHRAVQMSGGKAYALGQVASTRSKAFEDEMNQQKKVEHKEARQRAKSVEAQHRSKPTLTRREVRHLALHNQKRGYSDVLSQCKRRYMKSNKAGQVAGNPGDKCLRVVVSLNDPEQTFDTRSEKDAEQLLYELSGKIKVPRVLLTLGAITCSGTGDSEVVTQVFISPDHDTSGIILEQSIESLKPSLMAMAKDRLVGLPCLKVISEMVPRSMLPVGPHSTPHEGLDGLFEESDRLHNTYLPYVELECKLIYGQSEIPAIPAITEAIIQEIVRKVFLSSPTYSVLRQSSLFSRL